MNSNEIIINGLTTHQISLSILTIIMTLLLCSLLGVIIFTTYRYIYNNDNYKIKFNIFLVVTIFITSMVISLIKTNLISSIGLIGIISIVRFRVKLKDFREVSFILWAVAMGATVGMGYYLLGIIYSLIIALILIVLNIPLKLKVETRIMILRGVGIKLKKIEKVLVEEKLGYREPIIEKSGDLVECIYYLDKNLSLKKQEKLINKLEVDFIKFI